MWDFMKPPKVKSVCSRQPTHEVVKQIEEYRRYCLASIEGYYKKIVEELSFTDPDSLEVLRSAITEYKEVVAAMDAKLETLTHLNDDAIKDFAAELMKEYDAETETLTLSVWYGFGNG